MSHGDDGPPREKLQGCYANYFQIGHNAFEFVFEFGQSCHRDDLQGKEQVEIHSRIVTSPPSAKVLSEMLRESLDQYEQKFGSAPEASGCGPEGL